MKAREGGIKITRAGRRHVYTVCGWEVLLVCALASSLTSQVQVPILLLCKAIRTPLSVQASDCTCMFSVCCWPMSCCYWGHTLLLQALETLAATGETSVSLPALSPHSTPDLSVSTPPLSGQIPSFPITWSSASVISHQPAGRDAHPPVTADRTPRDADAALSEGASEEGEGDLADILAGLQSADASSDDGIGSISAGAAASDAINEQAPTPELQGVEDHPAAVVSARFLDSNAYGHSEDVPKPAEYESDMSPFAIVIDHQLHTKQPEHAVEVCVMWKQAFQSAQMCAP